MRKRGAIAALMLVLIAAAAAPPRAGEQAPGFTLRDQNGTRVSLADARGRKAVLVFYRGYW